MVHLCTYFRDECVFMERVGYIIYVKTPRIFAYIQWMLWTQWESECYLTWKLFWEIVRFYEQNSKQLFLIFSLSLFLVRGVSPLYSITRGPCNALKDQGFIMFYTGNMCAGPGQNRRGGVRGPPPVRHHHHYKTKEKTTRYLHHPCLRYRGTFPTFG